MAEDLSKPGTRGLTPPCGDSCGAQLLLAQALTHVPGYDPTADMPVGRLAGGRVNRTYRVLTPAGAFVLRWSPAPDAWLAADRTVERALHASAAAAGIAPRIVHASPEGRWLITEFIGGALWTAAKFADRGSLARLGDCLGRLHALPAPQLGRFDLLQALEGYARRLDRERACAHSALVAYLKEAAHAWRLSGAPCRPLAILHHDLHGANVIEAATGLMLIDWECAAVNDPLLDVACVLSYFHGARAHADVPLEHAGLGTVTHRQLAASVWLFDLHTWLWYRERRTRVAPTAAELRAERRLGAAVERGMRASL